MEFIASVPEFDRQVGGVSADVSSPPPIRRLPLEDTPAASQVAPPASTSTSGDGGSTSSGFTAAKRSIAAPQFSIRRMEIDNVSVSYADLQAVRVAKARSMSLDTVRNLIRQHTVGRALGFMGNPGVDVLQLNLALDKLSGDT